MHIAELITTLQLLSTHLEVGVSRASVTAAKATCNDGYGDGYDQEGQEAVIGKGDASTMNDEMTHFMIKGPPTSSARLSPPLEISWMVRQLLHTFPGCHMAPQSCHHLPLMVASPCQHYCKTIWRMKTSANRSRPPGLFQSDCAIGKCKDYRSNSTPGRQDIFQILRRKNPHSIRKQRWNEASKKAGVSHPYYHIHSGEA